MAVSLAAALSSTISHAGETRIVPNTQGQPVFEVRFFDQGEGPFAGYFSDPDQRSAYTLNEAQKAKITSAISYWANIIKPAAGQPVAIINVGTDDVIGNASGGSDNVDYKQDSYLMQLQAVLTGLADPGELPNGAHAQFTMGRLTSTDAPYIPSQVPLTIEEDMRVTALHELAHGLGISNSARNVAGPGTLQFWNRLGTWTEHMRDDYDNPAKPYQYVICSQCWTGPLGPGVFDVRKDQGYIAGDHISEVMDGAMRGVPVKMLGTNGYLDSNSMAHIELKNSLMSHQEYRNYTHFMEAELALLQDFGFDIDRRNFYGYSVYGDGKTLYNNHGYFRRNAEGTDYMVGAYNSSELGLGLHVYGSYNRIYQQADLLTNGAGAAGVRIDGVGNTLVVEPGTRIYGDGLNGRGILFAYGKDHNLVVRGDVQAMGEMGVGAEFNFGNNSLDNHIEYRGSYIRTAYGEEAKLLPELQGALVDSVDISGRLAGKAAAISISNNALVNTINILSSAKLEGNILSAYDEEDDDGYQRLTAVTFGRMADSQGRALNQADPNFRMTYGYNIQGINNLSLLLYGGETALNGKNEVYQVEVAKGATLSGTGTFTLNEDGTFLNSGTVSPGSAASPLGTITLNGDYRQTASGRLLVDVNDKGGHDTLKVNGNSVLNGRLSIAPQRGWYSPQWTLSTRDIVSATSTTGTFNQVDSTDFSPTLALHTTRNKDNSDSLHFIRDSDAYSQYAVSKSGYSVGESLSQSAWLVGAGDTDRQKLYTTLDFSAADGSTIGRALEQLSPSAYSAMIASSLQREQQIADAISIREPGKLRDDEWQAFIQPFGGNTRQNNDHDTIGYTSNSSGVIFGAETAATSDGNLIVGVHGAASKQKVDLKDPLRGDGNTTALELGVHARYAEDPTAGTYMLGSARIGYETGELKRKLNFDDYSAENKGDWNGKSASLVGGGGYRFKLNENVSLGPIATLTYTNLWRDGVHEKGADGSTLKLDSQKFDSLRSSIGLNNAMHFPLDSGHAIKVENQLTWNHELLDTDLTQDATFANYQGVKFKSKDTVMGRDSMGLRSNIRYSLNENVDIGAGVASDLFRTGYNSVSGNLSLDWRF